MAESNVAEDLQIVPEAAPRRVQQQVVPLPRADQRHRPQRGVRPAARRVGAFLRARPRLTFWLSFSLVLLVGGFLRFWRLGQQGLWIDEAATVFRIDKSFHQVIASLRGQGFPPGWYVALWAWRWVLMHWAGFSMRRSLTAASLRMLPAAFGTAAVAGSYFLGRQFFSRRVSLLVMLLTAVNPFLIYYSRDLKMYSPYACMTIVQAALFIQWQRLDKKRWLWFGLLVAATWLLAMADTVGWLMVGMEVVWLAGSRRARGFDALAFVLGAFAAALYPIWWYTHRTFWMTGVMKYHTDGGIGWIHQLTHMRWEAVAGLPCMQLLGYLWPHYPPPPWVASWFSVPDMASHLRAYGHFWLAALSLDLLFFLLAVLALGLLPWRRVLRRSSSGPIGRGNGGPAWWVALWVVLPVALFYCASLPKKDLFSIYPHRMVWEPRYMTLVVPAFILWLAFALCRLPTKVLRYGAAGVLLTASVASGLTNNLLYRQTPWNVVGKAVEPYFIKHRPFRTRMLVSPSRLGQSAQAYSMFIQVRKKSAWPNAIQMWWKYRPRMHYLPFKPGAWVRWLHVEGHSRYARTLVVLDELAARKPDPLPLKRVQQIIGPQWHLVRNLRFNQWIRWRYYLCRHWRLRIWTRHLPKPKPKGKPKPKPKRKP